MSIYLWVCSWTFLFDPGAAGEVQMVGLVCGFSLVDGESRDSGLETKLYNLMLTTCHASRFDITKGLCLTKERHHDFIIVIIVPFWLDGLCGYDHSNPGMVIDASSTGLD
jgi:hypothetical protein